ncbi:hypothetical protein [Microbacterium sp.]|uniref:hypothetical protein n=1 Tax=Microbacterium sp. TaxID=51671 RepID=UPI003A8CC566
MKIKHSVAVGFAAAALLVGAGALSASASNDVSYGGAVRADYNSSTNYLYAKDTKTDGLGVRVIYELSNGATGHLDNDQGYGTQTSKYISGSGTITFKVCTKDGPTTKNCSGWVSSTI